MGNGGKYVAGQWTHKNLTQGVAYLDRLQREKVEIVQVRPCPKVVRPNKKAVFAQIVKQNREKRCV